MMDVERDGLVRPDELLQALRALPMKSPTGVTHRTGFKVPPSPLGATSPSASQASKRQLAWQQGQAGPGAQHQPQWQQGAGTPPAGYAGGADGKWGAGDDYSGRPYPVEPQVGSGHVWLSVTTSARRLHAWAPVLLQAVLLESSAGYYCRLTDTLLVCLLPSHSLHAQPYLGPASAGGQSPPPSTWASPRLPASPSPSSSSQAMPYMIPGPPGTAPVVGYIIPYQPVSTPATFLVIGTSCMPSVCGRSGVQRARSHFTWAWRPHQDISLRVALVYVLRMCSSSC
jgi:hypothetical protein